MKKSLILATLVAVAVIAAVAYMQWKASPKYSLLQTARALENHDKNAFQKYVDVSAVLDGVITDSMNYAVKTARPEDAEKMQLGMGFMTLLKPSLIEMMKGKILQSVESGDFMQTDKTAAAKNQNMPDVTGGLAADQPDAMQSLKNFKPNKVEYVKKEGNVARVGIKIDGVQDIPVVELLMRKQDGYWQIFGIGNLEAFLKKAAEAKADAQMLMTLRIAGDSQMRYFLMNKRYAANPADLDISLPPDANTQYTLSGGAGGWIAFAKGLKAGHRLLLGTNGKGAFCCNNIDAGRCESLGKTANITFVPCPM